jgi:peptidyl-prolyl cis-trans isomerase SurA
MKKIGIILACSLFTVGAIAQNRANDPIIMEVNNDKVYKSDFEQIFWKNKKEDVTNKAELDEYLDLFVKFKLKVEAAEELGLDTTKKFRDEFRGYEIQLQKPYLADTTVNEALINEAYYRTVNELRASHLLILVDEDALPADTLKAYNKVLSIRNDILKGKLTFDEAAIKYSEDKSAASNKGDLGFFSAFRMVYPFEDAAYKTNIGDVSMPFRTQFGYHLVKPTETRKSRGKVKVAHVMVRVKKDATDEDKANAKKKINEIYAKAKAGEDFGTLVRDYSDDRNSVRKNGELEWVVAGRYFQEFEDAAFVLKSNGAISEPVLTQAGWHILKRIDFMPVDDITALRNELKNKIQKDVPRSQKTKSSFVNKLKKEYAFMESTKNLQAFYAKVDKTIENNEWTADKAEGMTAEIFSFAGKSYSQEDFANFIENTQRFNVGQSKIDYLNQLYKNYVNTELIEFEKTQLATKYPQYKSLLQEYRDGILLFEINDQKVWSYAIKDTAGLQKFYEANKNDHQWEERVDARIFTSLNKKTIKKAYKYVKSGKLRNDSIINLLNEDSQLNINFESGRYEVAQNDYLKDKNWKEGVNKPVMQDNKYVLIAIDKVLPPGPKALKEARGAYTAAYQEYLEKQWVDELKAKYKVTINKDVLYSIKNKPSSK